MATGLATSNFAFENFYDTTLSQDMTDTTLEAFLTTVPVGSEGTLIIDPTSPTKREIIYFTSKTALKVNIPANGRGYDNTTATTHTAGTRVIMGPIADWFNSLRDLFTTTPQGWTNLAYTPNTVTYLGNRSYECVFNGVDLTGVTSNGMRLRTTRTVTAPTKCTSLNGTNQYYSKSSPAGMTFTDDFTVSAWVKLSSYQAGNIASRYNGTSGWVLDMTAAGQIRLVGFKAGAANYSLVSTYQSLPLNKWVHVAAQLDMSAFTATTTTSYVMFDGVDVPASVSRSGTNPTDLTQAGNLEIGSTNGGTTLWAGKISQVAIYNAKVTQATIKASISQGLAGTETSLISAYSFNNSINDLNTTNANNLTANGSAVATNADSPFTQDDTGTPSGTNDFAIVTKKVFSTNTTLTVQVPEGCTIPTSGGVASASYSTYKAPYGFPTDKSKFDVYTFTLVDSTQTSPTQNTFYEALNLRLNAPVGRWIPSMDIGFISQRSGTGTTESDYALSTSTSAALDKELVAGWYSEFSSGGNSTAIGNLYRKRASALDITTATPYYLIYKTTQASQLTIGIFNTHWSGSSKVVFECAYV